MRATPNAASCFDEGVSGSTSILTGTGESSHNFPNAFSIPSGREQKIRWLRILHRRRHGGRLLPSLCRCDWQGRPLKNIRSEH